MGRFINKDPIEEQGGLNLYAFCRNNGVNSWDVLGMGEVGYDDDGIPNSYSVNNYTDAGDNWTTFSGYGWEWLDWIRSRVGEGGGAMEEFENIHAPRGMAAIMGGSGFTNASSANVYLGADLLLQADLLNGFIINPADYNGAGNARVDHDKIATVKLGELIVSGETPEGYNEPTKIAPYKSEPDYRGLTPFPRMPSSGTYNRDLALFGAVVRGFENYSNTFAMYEIGAMVVANGAVMLINPAALEASGGMPLSGAALARPAIANPVPTVMARVIPNGTAATTLGRAGATDVFVTAADDIAGMNSSQIAQRLGIPNSTSGFRVIEFPTPSTGVASPVFRSNPGFIQGGRTIGGAREFVVPNQPIPSGATVKIVPGGG